MKTCIARRFVLLVSALIAGSSVLAAAPASATVRAKIIRSAYGVPTIEAKDWSGLGFGAGHAIAEDHICAMAEAFVTANGERSRYFGSDAEAPGGFSNLDSDFFFQRIKARGTVERLVATPPPMGPKQAVRELVEGYAAGYNRYLVTTGVADLPDPRCAGKPWVRQITPMDVYRRFYFIVEAYSGLAAVDGIANAQPPDPNEAVRSAGRASRLAIEENAQELGEALDLPDLGSNGWGLGSGATANRSGMLLANPHVPWQGSERFYQSHLVIPGKVNVSGATLFGLPMILIGHTHGLAWTHTDSTAFRFAPIELDLVPGDPTSYLVDGEPERMEADQVTVQTLQPDGSLTPVTRTLYSTRYGPVFDTLEDLPLFAWTPTTAYAMFDANAENFRFLNHAFDTNTAQSTGELLQILRKYEGLPGVNTIAADSHGQALYADIGTLPNVPDAKAVSCASEVGQITFPAIGLPVLDGSRAECAPATDADSAAPGIMGSAQQPYMLRRDYVANSNNSHWLTNSAQPLEGYARIIGDERTPRSLRTRLGLIMIEQRLGATDGLPGDKFTLDNLGQIMFNDRLYAGELFRSQLATYCHGHPILIGSSGPVDVSGACAALDGWDERMNLDSTGAVLFKRFMTRLGSIPFTNGFELADPVHTPFGLNTSNPKVGVALADAVTDLAGAGIPLDAPLGDWQYVEKSGERIPIHGGPGAAGSFNAITTAWDPARGYPNPTHGSTFVMLVSFSKDGDRCPRDRSITTYSQSDNPTSPFFADQTRLYSQKGWNDPPFCLREVRRDAQTIDVLRER